MACCFGVAPEQKNVNCCSSTRFLFWLLFVFFIFVINNDISRYASVTLQLPDLEVVSTIPLPHPGNALYSDLTNMFYVNGDMFSKVDLVNRIVVWSKPVFSTTGISALSSGFQELFFLKLNIIINFILIVFFFKKEELFFHWRQSVRCEHREFIVRCNVW